MPFYDALQLACRHFHPILLLEDVFPYERRERVRRIIALFTFVFFGLALLIFLAGSWEPAQALPGYIALMAVGTKVYGLFLIFLSIQAALFMLEAFHRSYYFTGLKLILQEPDARNEVPVSFEVAALLHSADREDLTASFLQSPYGEDIAYRLGLLPEEVEGFLRSSDRKRLAAEEFLLEREPDGITLPVYVRSIYKQDLSLNAWLMGHGVTREHVLGAADWIMRTNRLLRNNQRWYSRDVLGRVESIGKEISYGETTALEKWGHTIDKEPSYQTAVSRMRDEYDDVESLEEELARAEQANAILVGREQASLREVLAQFAHKIAERRVLPPLRFKKVFLFNFGSLAEAMKTKPHIEEEFSRALTQAASAGNVILVVENAGRAIENARRLGVDLVGLLAPYLDLPSLQVVFTTDEEYVQRVLLRDARVKEKFEVVHIHDVSDDALVRIAEQRALRLERRLPVVITFQAVLAAVQSARRYFSENPMPDKALDLLEEAAIRAEEKSTLLVTPATIDEVVEKKTGIPLGAVGKEEGEKLLRLEETLARRVAGQEEALKAIAGALRRARADLASPDRPMGTFLFLGPTGVGKTETAKALAYELFGSETAMTRLDMSEFQGEDAVARLIGFPDGREGRLAHLLRQKPYAVLLLDEFEKAHPDVHNLFLQILDEGEFTDAQGTKVNARNMIIIATSNAGADVIYEAVEQGATLEGAKEKVVDLIIERGIYRPELLNRFDAVVLFHPLDAENTHRVARKALEALRARLQKKGIVLEITDALVAYVAREGHDPRFGGRNINRFVKEKVEQHLADRIIAGEITPGSVVVLTPEDLGKSVK